jgi:hypothetical protein
MKKTALTCAIFVYALTGAGSADARPHYSMPGRAMPAVPAPRDVANKSLSRALIKAYSTLATSYTRAASGDACFARPARRQLWQSVDALSTKKTAHESPELRQAVADLKRFKQEFGAYRDTGDQRLQVRLLSGYSRARPGIMELLQHAFKVAGMGKVATFRDNAPR